METKTYPTETKTIHCADCNKIIPDSKYGVRIKDKFGTLNMQVNIKEYVCYDCCGKEDWKYMRETGKATMYLTFDVIRDLPHPHIGHGEPTVKQRDGKYKKLTNIKIGNWPGSLSFPVSFMRVGRHNIANVRYDAYMTDLDGNKWHCVRYGNNTEICHCKRMKNS